MTNKKTSIDLVTPSRQNPASNLPNILKAAGSRAVKSFFEFFGASIRNKNTREAYLRAALRFFKWCETRNLAIESIEAMHIAGYVEQLGQDYPPETVKVHLSAIKRLYDFLVTRQVVPFSPAASVRGPKVFVSEGKTPVLAAEELRTLLDSIDTSEIRGMRDRAIITLMYFTFARVGAVRKLKVSDFYRSGDEWHIKLREKGSKIRDLPMHPEAARFIRSYLENAGLTPLPSSPLFQTTHGRSEKLSGRPMHRNDILAMIKRHALLCGLSPEICCHTFRATGITRYMDGGGRIEQAQRIAGHADARTTKLYDRSENAVRMEEIKKIEI